MGHYYFDKANALGARSSDSIKPSDAKEWAIRMSEMDMLIKTINYKRSLVFISYCDWRRLCSKNFDFQLNTVIDDDTVPKAALTTEQEERLLSFAKADKTYSKNYDETGYLKNGSRISEFGGLTLPDLISKRLVKVDHQLPRDTGNGYYIEIKTKSGERQVLMVEEAHQAASARLAKSEP